MQQLLVDIRERCFLNEWALLRSPVGRDKKVPYIDDGSDILLKSGIEIEENLSKIGNQEKCIVAKDGGTKGGEQRASGR